MRKTSLNKILGAEFSAMYLDFRAWDEWNDFISGS
jgi:hypothetical protein